MSDPKFPIGNWPSPPPLPSIPKGPDRGRELSSTAPPPANDAERLMGMLRETSAAAANLGELVTKLQTALACTQMALLTYEHQVHNAHDRIDLLESRVADLEDEQPEAAE